MQKQKEDKIIGSYLDCFGRLTFDVMGYTGSLVHVSGPWTVHDPRRSSRMYRSGLRGWTSAGAAAGAAATAVASAASVSAASSLRRLKRCQTEGICISLSPK